MRKRSHSVRHVVKAFLNTPWAILPDKLTAMSELLALRQSGERFSKAEIRARLGGEPQPKQSQDIGAVRVLPLFGTIMPRAGSFHEISGGTSAERFLSAFNDALSDDSVAAILIDADTPGGSVHGIDKVSKAIFEARGIKPIKGVARYLVASAGYHIWSACDECIVEPSSQAGSIGVFMAHQDYSKAYEKLGIKTTLISAGKYKVEGNQYEPLGEEAQANLQEIVNDFYAKFVGDVARNRGVSVSAVTSGFGQGRLVTAEQAVALKMADRVATFESVLGELGATQVIGGLQTASERRRASATKSFQGAGATDMNPRIFAALVQAGLIDLEASDQVAEKKLSALLELCPAKSNQPKDVLAAISLYSAALADEDDPDDDDDDDDDDDEATSRGRRFNLSAGSADTIDMAEVTALCKVSRLDAEGTLAVQEQLTAGSNRKVPLTHKRAYEAITAYLAERSPETGPVVTVTQDSADTFRAEAANALITRHYAGNLPKEVWDERSGQMVAFKPARKNYELQSLKGLAKLCLIRSGATHAALSRYSDVEICRSFLTQDRDFFSKLGINAYAGDQAYHTTGMFPSVLLDAARVVSQREYEEAPSTFERWAARDPDVQDFRLVHNVVTGAIGDPKVILENDEFQEVTLTEAQEEYPVQVWGMRFSMTFELMTNDQLGKFLLIPGKMADAFRRKRNKLAYGVLKDNPTMADTGALFNATAVTTPGGHANLVTAGGPPTVATLDAGYLAMSQQPGLGADSGPIGLEPRFILAPPALASTVRTLLTASADPSQVNPNIPNPYQGGLEPVIDAQLGASAGGSNAWWFLLAGQGQAPTVSYKHLQGYETPRIESAESFERLTMAYRMWFVFGVGATEWRGAYENDGVP